MQLAETLQRLMALCLLLFGPMALYANPGTIVLLLLMATIAAVLARRMPGGSRVTRSSAVAALFGMLMIWFAASCAWAENVTSALLEIGEIALVVTPGVLLFWLAPRFSDAARATLGRSFWIGLCAACVMLLIELSLGAPLGTLIRGESAAWLRFTNHAAATLAVGFWPALALAAPTAKHVWLPLGAWLLALIALALSPSTASAVAFVFASAVFVLAWLQLRRVLVLLGAVSALIALSAPWMIRDQLDEQGVFHERVMSLPSSWQHRIVIWRYASTMALDAPLVGHGMYSSHFSNASEHEINRYEGIAASTESELIVDQFPTHPHNSTLQIWFEFGLVGAAIYVSLLASTAVALYRRASRARTRCSRTRLCGCAGLGALSAYLVFANISFGAFQGWWLALIGTCVFAWRLASLGHDPGGRAAQ